MGPFDQNADLRILSENISEACESASSPEIFGSLDQQENSQTQVRVGRRARVQRREVLPIVCPWFPGSTNPHPLHPAHKPNHREPGPRSLGLGEDAASGASLLRRDPEKRQPSWEAVLRAGPLHSMRRKSEGFHAFLLAAVSQQFRGRWGQLRSIPCLQGSPVLAVARPSLPPPLVQTIGSSLDSCKRGGCPGGWV